LVEVAISILRADPKEDVTLARGWALDIIEKNSGVMFSDEDRQGLLHKPLVTTLAAELKGMAPQVFITTTTSKTGIDAANAFEKELRDLGMTVANRQALDPAQIVESKVSCYSSDTCKWAKALVLILRSKGYTLGEADTSNRAEDNSVDPLMTMYNSKAIRIVLLDPKPSQPATSPSPLQGR
jgi:hypothetical protein